MKNKLKNKINDKKTKPLSSFVSLTTASSTLSPGSINPARHEYMFEGKFGFLPNKHF